MGGNETVRMRMRSAGQEWWDAPSWSGINAQGCLMSLLVKGICARPEACQVLGMRIWNVTLGLVTVRRTAQHRSDVQDDAHSAADSLHTQRSAPPYGCMQSSCSEQVTSKAERICAGGRGSRWWPC